jgi:hypothetical protein
MIVLTAALSLRAKREVLMYMEPLAHRLYLTVIAPRVKPYVRTDNPNILFYTVLNVYIISNLT